MEIKIKGKNITLKYSFRGFMIYEKITGESFNPKGITEILVYFYSTIIGSAKDLDLEFDEFMDYLDENPGLVEEFSGWLASVMSRNSYINQSQDKEKTEEDPKKD
jgi:hypothetical protein